MFEAVRDKTDTARRADFIQARGPEEIARIVAGWEISAVLGNGAEPTIR
jgi:hypothetical protein